MHHPKQSENKDSHIDESGFNAPRIALLGEAQWSYIQRWYRMGRRELQVAKLACKGFSNEEIAKKLRIKPGTVKTHLQNIYRRIRVKNKISMLLKVVDQAAKFSTKGGITPPIPVVEIKKPVQKPLAPAQLPKTPFPTSKNRNFDTDNDVQIGA